jgi:hypothetical protein
MMAEVAETDLEHGTNSTLGATGPLGGDAPVWHNAPMVDELECLQLLLSAGWSSKTVTTDPPGYVPHEEWRLTVQLTAESSFRVAHILTCEQRLSWGLSRKLPATRFTLEVHFFPHAWKTSDDVQINFGGRRGTVTDRALKEDPRGIVAVTLPEAAETGCLIPVFEVPEHGISVVVLGIAGRDTEERRNERWRVRPHLASRLPVGLEPLASGYQSGVIHRDE